MTTQLKWKRKDDCGQTFSQCGRYWFVTLRGEAGNYGPGEIGEVRLWHGDTEMIVGHFPSASEAKAAAEHHLKWMWKNGARGRGEAEQNPVDEFTIDGARIVCTRVLNQVEVDNEIWPETTVALELENGIVLYASRDPEGNGPGALFGQYKDGGCFQLGVSNLTPSSIWNL